MHDARPERGLQKQQRTTGRFHPTLRAVSPAATRREFSQAVGISTLPLLRSTALINAPLCHQGDAAHGAQSLTSTTGETSASSLGTEVSPKTSEAKA